MDVELQVIAGCPHAGSARELLRQAMDDIGLSQVAVRTTVIATDEDARERGFVGSPTFSVDGHDLFADVGATPAVSCRLYRNSTGVAGLPALRRLREVLKQAVDSGATAD